MAITPEDGKEILNYYRRRVNQYGDANVAYEHTIKSLITNQKYELRDIKTLFGENAKSLVKLGFNPAYISMADEWARELQKVSLGVFLERRNSSLNKLEEILTIYYLRHLQELEWEDEGNYISYDRIKNVFDAEDYRYDNLGILTMRHFMDYEDIDLTDYILPKGKEIDDFLLTIIESYSDLDVSQRIRKLQEYAKDKGYLETFIESPDRLREMPQHYDVSSGPLWGSKEQVGAVRFAPTPNGPLHIGHGRGISLLADYAERYGMEFLLRFDDTNQDKVKKSSNLPKEFKIDDVYEHIIDDVGWIIGRRPDRIIYSSDKENLLRYEAAATELIEKGYAFVLFDTGNKENPYEYGKSVEENLYMFDEMLDAGANPPWEGASVILGVHTGYKNSGRLYMRNSPRETEEEHIDRVRREVNNYIKENVYAGTIKNSTLKSLNNTKSGSRIMGNQKIQNIRVKARGEKQWAWPKLSLQSVVDDEYYNVTHALRGTEYDLRVAQAEKDIGVQHTIYFQGVLRMLLGAPPVYTASNWGNVSWDGWIWNYDKESEKDLKEKTGSMSTSIIKLGIMDGKYEGGFLNGDLPTIYSLRVNPDHRGSSFKFYWTRFDLPNDINPTFIREDYRTLNEELQQAFPNEERLKEKNEEIISKIENLQEDQKYLAEDYSSSE